MTRFVVGLLVLLVSCGPCDTELFPSCPNGATCWIDEDGGIITANIPHYAGVGECSTGVISCVEKSPSCVGAVRPRPESCDGNDNDCDGDVDEYATFDPRAVDCTEAFCGVCRGSYYAHCVAGEVVCASAVTPSTEVCDGRDNDCNCAVDDDVEIEFFYDGPENTVGRGECRPGVRYCDFGVTRELAPTYPTEEICDGKDNDCDAFIDESDPTEPQAFYLVFDVSGSMGTTVTTIAQAFCDFSLAAPVGSLYAVSTVASTWTLPNVDMVQDFADAQTTCSTLMWGGLFAQRAGAEYMLEPLVFPLSWPSLDTHTILFTDETLQYYVVGNVEAGAVCVAVPYDVTIYTRTTFFPSWTSLVDLCGGTVREIPPNTIEAVSETLIQTFLGSCGI